MLSWIKAAFNRAMSFATSGIAYTLGGIPISKLWDFQSYLFAGSRKCWVAWKCADIVATSVSSTPFAVFNKGQAKPVTNLPEDLSRLLSTPNELLTLRELIYLTAMHIKLTGNAFWFKAQPMKTGDRPLALFPLNPKRIWVVPGRQQGQINGYVYHCNGVVLPLEPYEIIHFRRPHPDNDFYGLGDIEAGEDLFNDHINRAEWMKKHWANGATPNAVLINEDQITDEEEWQKAKEKWAREYGGTENAGKTAWLTGKWRYQQIGLSAQDMQHVELSRWNVEQICLQMGVPQSVLGLEKAANFATADIDNQRYKQYTVLPIALLISDTLNSDLIQGWGENLQLLFQTTDLINVGKAMVDLAPAFDRGVLCINEMRKVIGLSTDDGNELWNQHFINTALVPLELSGVQDLQGVDDQAQGAVDRARQGTGKVPPGDSGGGERRAELPPINLNLEIKGGPPTQGPTRKKVVLTKDKNGQMTGTIEDQE